MLSMDFANLLKTPIFGNTLEWLFLKTWFKYIPTDNYCPFNYLLNLTFKWRRSLSYRNQPIDLVCKSIDWFVYHRDLSRERVKIELQYSVRTKARMQNTILGLVLIFLCVMGRFKWKKKPFATKESLNKVLRNFEKNFQII